MSCVGGPEHHGQAQGGTAVGTWVLTPVGRSSEVAGVSLC